MKRFLTACIVALCSIAYASAGPAPFSFARRAAGHAPPLIPDFWYVVSGDSQAPEALQHIHGIVIPHTSRPTVQTSLDRNGSVIRWTRPNGTSLSFVIDGIPALQIRPGPIAGTYYIPFKSEFTATTSDSYDTMRAIYLDDTDSCCSCASWINSVDSIEFLQCISGCEGCGCEGCICTPTYPCPGSDFDAVLGLKPYYATLAATPQSAAQHALTIRSGEVTINTIGFRGQRLETSLDKNNRLTFTNPDSISLGQITDSSAEVRDGTARFAWQSGDTTVIVEQPEQWPAPSYSDGAIDLTPNRSESSSMPASTTSAKYLELQPNSSRCRACGTYPDHWGNLETYTCDPGSTTTCYRCVSWEC